MSESMSPAPSPTPPAGEGGREPAEAVGREDRVERVFDSAVERPTGERLRFVDEACKDDAELGERVRRLLDAYERAGEKLDQIVSPELQLEFARPKPEEEGEFIGRYKLLQEIGQGGFGTVWVAEQIITAPARRAAAAGTLRRGVLGHQSRPSKGDHHRDIKPSNVIITHCPQNTAS
jgi:hypothetical protein